MSSLAAPFEVVDLARHQAAEFAHERSVLAKVYRMVPGKLMRVLEDLCANLVLRFVTHHTRRLAQQEVWFSGAQMAIEQLPADHLLDPEDMLRSQLDAMELGLTEIARGATGIANNVDRARQRPGLFTTGLRRMATAATELRLEVRGFKGALQAHDANVSALQHARRVCTTTAELDAELARALA